MSVLDAVHRIGPDLAARSREIEELRSLPADVVDLLLPTGAFRQYLPAELDGPGVTAWEALRALEELAWHDGSCGWCAAIGSTTSLAASYLPDRWARELFGDADAVGGGFAAPMGRARPVEGGLRVSGRWQWGSGTRHCTTIGGGCLVVDGDGRPAPREDGLAAPFVFFDPSDVELLDTWDVAGLCGTGSTDYAVHDAFVPEGRWLQLGVDPPVHDGPWGRFSFFGLLAASVAATAVGVARRSVDEVVELAGGKRPAGSARTLAQRAPVQAEIARAEASLGAAWGLLGEAIQSTWQTACAGEPASLEQKRRLRLAASHATQTAADVAAAMFRTAGGAAVYRDSPIQRCFRDTAVAAQHAMVAPRTFETVGRIRLGLDTEVGAL